MDSHSRCCSMYDPETEQVTKIVEMETARSHHSCVVFAGKIVVTGGLSDRLERSVEAYDIFKNKWSNMPSLIEERAGHDSVAFGNKLYVIGGVGTQSCEVYNYISKKFTLIKPMPLLCDYNEFGNFEYSFFWVKDKIIVKYDTEDKEKDNIYIYDTKEDKWSLMCPEYFKENEGHVVYK